MAALFSMLAIASVPYRLGSLVMGHVTLDIDGACLSLLFELPHINPDPPTLAWQPTLIRRQPARPHWWFDHQDVGEGRCLSLPLWPLIAAASLASWRLATSRTPPGRCPRCGYSTHNLPPNSPCPECGR